MEEQKEKEERHLRYGTEHSQLMEHIKFYASMRYAILAAFAALTGGILSVAFKEETSEYTKLALKFGGIFVSLTCWVAEASAAIIWAHFVKRAVCLEKALGYTIYRAFPEIEDLPVPKQGEHARKAKLRLYWCMLRKQPTTLVVFLLYWLVAVFWTVALVLTKILSENPTSSYLA